MGRGGEENDAGVEGGSAAGDESAEEEMGNRQGGLRRIGVRGCLLRGCRKFPLFLRENIDFTRASWFRVR